MTYGHAAARKVGSACDQIRPEVRVSAFEPRGAEATSSVPGLARDRRRRGRVLDERSRLSSSSARAAAAASGGSSARISGLSAHGAAEAPPRRRPDTHLAVAVRLRARSSLGGARIRRMPAGSTSTSSTARRCAATRSATRTSGRSGSGRRRATERAGAGIRRSTCSRASRAARHVAEPARVPADVPRAARPGRTDGRRRVRRRVDVVRRLAVRRLAGDGRYHTYLCDEIVPFVDSRYRTRGRRGVTGKSCGGYGAAVTAMLRPDLFDGFAATRAAGSSRSRSAPSSAWPRGTCGTATAARSSASSTTSAAARARRTERHAPAAAVGLLGGVLAGRPTIRLPYDVATAEVIPELWERGSSGTIRRSCRGTLTRCVDARDLRRRGQARRVVPRPDGRVAAAAPDGARRLRPPRRALRRAHAAIEYRYPLGLRYLAERLPTLKRMFRTSPSWTT